jgi:hypothetical protein
VVLDHTIGLTGATSPIFLCISLQVEGGLSVSQNGPPLPSFI